MHVSGDFKDFLGRTYTEAFAGGLIDWVKDKSTRDYDKLIAYIGLVINDAMPQTLIAAQKAGL